MFSKKEDSNQTLAASSNKVTIHQWKQYDWQTYNHFLSYHTRSIAIIDCNKVANEEKSNESKLLNDKQRNNQDYEDHIGYNLIDNSQSKLSQLKNT